MLLALLQKQIAVYGNKEQVVSKAEFIERKALVREKIEAVNQEIAKLKKLVITEQKTNNQEKQMCEYGGIERLDRGVIEAFVDVVWVFDVGQVKVDLRYGIE